MPIYEYRCKNCGEFEIMQRMSEAPLTRCPTCRAKVTKLISNTSFQLKGSGWYATDYARKGTGSDVGKESKTDGKSETKTESKAEKSDGKSEKASKTTEAAAA